MGGMKRRLIAGAINCYPAEPGWENTHLDKSDRALYDIASERMGAPPAIVADLADLLSMQQLHRSFDEVRCWQVLEHLTPFAAPRALAGFHAVLRPGGALDLEVPNVEALIEGWRAERLTWDEMLWNLYGQATEMPDDHLNAHRWGWSPVTLHDAIVRAGFEPPEQIDPGYQLRFRTVRP